jgi:amino acid adenylation domain-containing protein
VQTSSAAWSHAYHVRLPASVTVPAVARRFAEAVTRWWPDAEPRRAQVWCERMPAGSLPPDRWLDRELHRPAGDPGAPPRAVVLCHPDGAADLVLVAHRATLDPQSLLSVASVLTGRVRLDEVEVRPGGLTDAIEHLSWGLGDTTAGDRTGMTAVALPGGLDRAETALAVAAAIVVGRYEQSTTPVLGGTVASRPALAGRTVGDLLADVARAPEPTPAPLGILTDALCPADGRVLPCQAPPWPVTLVPRISADGQVELELHHRLRDLDGAAAGRLAGQLAHVYAQVRDGARDLPAAEVELLDDAAAAHHLALGVTIPEPVAAQRIDAAFRAVAARCPDAVALVCGAMRLTYRELAERSARYAAGLAALGVRPGDRIGVCLERSTDLVVTLLAVLEAGGVYVPMDPAYPKDRLEYTVDDAGLRVVVADTEFPAIDGTRLIRPGELAEAGTGDGPPDGERDAAAYVIYTSGSTGRPKGVVVTHRSVLALIAATAPGFGFGQDDTWTLFHSSAFDVSVWEMWGSLLTGGRLVVVPYWVSRSPDEFHTLLRRERVTVLNQTPSAFTQLMDADRRQERPLGLRLVIFAGEPLDTRALTGWLDRYPEHRCRLVNMFGITETCVHVTAQTVSRRDALSGSRSVGRPIPGWHVRILDERGLPVPIGVPGEIYVGGAGVAVEYLGRPELTTERFRPDPFGPGRLYRSGDAGRFLSDGRIEHLGRLDNQVQLRGFRIELDEIRHVLLGDPAVTAAAVVVGGGAELARLDAYVVLAAEPDDDTWVETLRELAARKLPEYMVPATITAVTGLPLTVNGKLDVRRLPEPARAGTGSRPVPGDGDAAKLAEVWEAVLGVPVGFDDNFFRLGGNSLAAVRVRTAMRARGLPELPLRQFYLTPTVRTFAERLAFPAATRKAHDVR